ncbi:hypothetical protein Rsub_08750 [Raphidocelis subcapitata]|uniref:Protein kinase domain-containing protein n=1 Tax=Raphidocelis subcapitata TaxID=307507 RepID=A0A2V0PGL4_9CHLO|nr:hypothetical protein Rsub_08750 [Raphidocelis subcapitata]|eukprot:GBF96205.1 hypothetical protein Rsub_08750 [Raphidocelis subcapitata]
MALAVAAPKSHIHTLHELLEATHDAYVASEAAGSVEEVAVDGAGRRLSCWPPLLSTFDRVTKLVMRGHFMTSLPSSVGDMRSLRVLSVTGGTLASIPQELARLSDLRELDLGRNELRVFPHQLCALKGLTALNLMGNRLEQLPDRFGDLSGLYRLGLKSNGLRQLPGSFTRLTNLVELFITDNKLTELPEGFGALASLVKLQASFNPLAKLPADILNLPRLELFRLAAGDLPDWPRPAGGSPGASGLPPALAWCSMGGNPAAAPLPRIGELPLVDVSEVEVDRQKPLGEGASGECFRATFRGERVALKLFLAEVSPDGKAQDEVAITCALQHPNVTRVKAVVFDRRDPWPGPRGDEDYGADAAAPGSLRAHAHAHEAARGMVLELIAGKPLAAKPTSEHLLRCKWAPDVSFPLPEALTICLGIGDALAYLHARRVCHGDVYAHNILYCPDSRRAVLCDFGASFCYREEEGFWELMEVRAFGIFMSDVAARISASDAATPAARRLGRLADRCAAPGGERPRFAEVVSELKAVETAAPAAS